MAKSPFLLKDGTNLLTSFGKRVGLDPTVSELRVDMNGWRSQMLIHDVHNFSDILLEDLEPYASDKKYKPKSPAVVSVLTTLLNSQQLSFMRNPNGDLSFTTADLDFSRNITNEQLIAFGAAVKKFEYGAETFRMRCEVGGQGNIGAWSGAWSKWREGDHFTGSRLESYLREHAHPQNSVDYSGFANPVAKFRSMVSENLGIPEDFVWFYRSMPRNMTTTAVGTHDYIIEQMNYAGYTVIIAPLDCCSEHGLFLVPKIPGVAKVAVAIDPAYEFGSKTWGYVSYNRWTQEQHGIPADIVTEFGLNTSGRFSGAWAGANDNPYKDAHIVADVDPNIGELSSVSLGIDTEIDATLGSPVYEVRGDNGLWGPYVAGHDLSVIRIQGKFYAKPNGIIDLTLSNGSFNVINGGDGYGNVIGISPTKIRCGMSMHLIREHLKEKRNEPGLKPGEVAQINKAISESEKYIDGIIRGTVYNRTWPYPDRSAIENLYLVKQSDKVGIDLMNEDLSGGNTLNKVVSKFEKLRSKSHKVSCATYVNDEELTLDSLASPIISDRLYGYKWRYRAILDPDNNIVGWSGYYDGGDEETIPASDAAVLIAIGATMVQPSTITVQEVLAHLELNQDMLDDMSTIVRTSVGGARRTFDGDEGLTKLAFGAQSFLDGMGYPVIDCLTTDGTNRAIISHKGFGEDPSGFFLSLLFVNQLDIVKG